MSKRNVLPFVSCLCCLISQSTSIYVCSKFQSYFFLIYYCGYVVFIDHVSLVIDINGEVPHAQLGVAHEEGQGLNVDPLRLSRARPLVF